MLEFLHFSWVDILDILMVAAIIYLVFRWIRGSTAINIFIAIIIVIVIRVIAEALGMKMISSLLGTLIDMGAVALVVIFQPEVRRFLSTVGRTAGSTLEKQTFLQRIFPGWQQHRNVDTRSLQEISEACREMSAQKTGALILIQNKNSLEDIVATGDIVDAEIGRRLIMNIFFKNSPLHDGAMVIGGNRIVAARCTLPITERTDLPARYGMRHKAAIGISEQCDADVVVVSEETGGISFVRGGQITPIDTINTLNLLLGEKTP
ncbi:MAG: diadenylate cyclase CdaA [Bacteroidales bacterium]|nr:diadenylate cyclase CdaA [Bacteroidales bacterium]MBR1488271.1 diadenylate cyclase CdaA [Bacteroidales bacterium]MBR1577857.1 diadenylate cyclase CdaA [Bacteroidales bacterium]MDO4998846.1 diadenylate cyclase CdaA [Bacteroidales bacterium]